MKTIKLYGSLKHKYGKEFDLDVDTPAEAFRALCANLPGFEADILGGNTLGYRVWVDDSPVSPSDAQYPLGRNSVMKVAPVTIGAGTGAEILLADIIWYAAAIIATNWVTIAIMAANYLLSPTPEMPKDNARGERPENTPSYVFSGPVNTVAQGHPVPIGYGEMYIGSQVISSGLYVEQI